MTHSRRFPQRLAWTTVVLGMVTMVWAQEGPSAAELRRMYDETVAQLKGAQDRKNELAVDNDKLAKRLAEAEFKLKTLEARNTQLEAESADYARKTWQQRSLQAAWEIFLSRHPDIRRTWNQYLSTEAPPPPTPSPASWLHRTWPLSDQG